MIDFQYFLDMAGLEGVCHYVYVLPKSSIRIPTLMRLVDEAHEAGLSPYVNRDKYEVSIGQCTARFVIAHSHLVEQLRGYTITNLVAGDAFDALENGRQIENELRARLR